MHSEHNNRNVSSGGVAAKVDITSPTAMELLPLVSCTTSLLLRSGASGFGLLSQSTQRTP
eukprot:5550574-Amphidinium_carterae.1